MKFTRGLAVAGLVWLAPAVARAQTFNLDQKSGGVEYRATVQFQLIANSQWRITVTNLGGTSNGAASVLSGIRWRDHSGSEHAAAARIDPGSKLVDGAGNAYSTTDAVGNHWGYGNVAGTASGSTFNQAITSGSGFAGLTNANFGGVGNSLNAVGWGVTNGASGVNSSSPFVSSSMTFIVTGVQRGDWVSSVLFQFGSGAGAQSFVKLNSNEATTPEGSPMLMMLFGLVPLLAIGVLLKRRQLAV